MLLLASAPACSCWPPPPPSQARRAHLADGHAALGPDLHAAGRELERGLPRVRLPLAAALLAAALLGCAHRVIKLAHHCPQVHPRLRTQGRRAGRRRCWEHKQTGSGGVGITGRQVRLVTGGSSGRAARRRDVARKHGAPASRPGPAAGGRGGTGPLSCSQTSAGKQHEGVWKRGRGAGRWVAAAMSAPAGGQPSISLSD